jgi:hypothetical protein
MSRSAPVFPPVRESESKWRGRVADEIERLAQDLPPGKTRKGRLRKATAYRLCARRVRVTRCNECGTLQAGSGVLMPAEGAYPCNARTCPLCARRDASKRRIDLRGRVAAITPRPDHRVRHVILTTSYDPTDPAEVTFEALGRRADGLLRAFDAAWRKGLGQPGAGAYWAVELGDTGAVHMHVFYIGPFIVKEWLERTLHDAYDACGFTWIREAEGDEAIGEVCKYLTKTSSPLCESWFTKGRVGMHPTLVARWEVATESRRLHGRRGVLRTVKPVDPPPEPDAGVLDDRFTDAQDAFKDFCEKCGSKTLEDVVVGTLEYLKHQHARGVRGLKGSRARPPAPSPRPPPPVTVPGPAPWSPRGGVDATAANHSGEWTEEWVAA